MEYKECNELKEILESQFKVKNEINDYMVKFNKMVFNQTKELFEEISDEGLSKIRAAFQGKPIEYLQEKVINLHKQINKDRIKRKNQREELHKLNLKLQKCISFEEHNKIIEKINKGNVNYLSNSIISRDKEIEKLKAVIEYLESKVK